MTRRLSALLALAALAACSREAPPVARDEAANESVNVALPEPEPPAPPAAANATNEAAANAAVPAEEPVAEDAQMQEDADATGMTARVSRDDNASEPAAENQ